MSDRRYINLRVTPQKWENEYFGDFEAPIALYPAPSRPTPSPTRTPTPTPSVSPTPSVTPSITPTSSVTPTVTPTSSPIPVTPSITPTQSATPSVTPTQTITPTSSITPTPSITPTFTPTPSSTPLPQYFILAENTDEILTEGADNLITQDGPSQANINMSGMIQGTRIQVVNLDTSTTLIDASVSQDTYTATESFTGAVNLRFTWSKMVSTDELYSINVYENEGGVQGRLLESSPSSNSGSFTYTGNTDVFITASHYTTNGNILNVTSGAGVFTYLNQTWSPYSNAGQWGIDSGNNNTPWSSNQYQTGIITPGDPGIPPYKMVFVRTSLGAWTRYTYTFSTKIWSNPQNIGTGTSNYGTQDQSTLVDNL